MTNLPAIFLPARSLFWNQEGTCYSLVSLDPISELQIVQSSDSFITHASHSAQDTMRDLGSHGGPKPHSLERGDIFMAFFHKPSSCHGFAELRENGTTHTDDNGLILCEGLNHVIDTPFIKRAIPHEPIVFQHHHALV